ncbi:MAG: proton-conducting transporter membrane subunit [Deltaproteobacteria bacterium]|nr:proton-conducting transporter membrane subunit [Deltaproteobacteria bacterium]
MNLLLASVALPLCAALVVAVVPRVFDRLPRAIALLGSAAGALAVAGATFRFVPSDASVQLRFTQPFDVALGVDFSLAVDGISLAFLIVGTGVCLLTLLVRTQLGPRAGDGCFALLLVQSALAGVYTSQNALLFWCFWALFVFGTFLLVGLQGGARRLLASSKLALSGFTSLVMLLGVFLYLGAQMQQLTGRVSFNFDVLTRVLLPLSTQYVVMIVALLALALALPLVPLAGWWSDTHAQSPNVASVVLLVGPALYALIRILLPCFPLAAFHLMPLLGGVAAVTAIIAAIAAPFEDDLRRRLAWVACTQTAVAVVGVTSLSTQGIVGAILLICTSAVALAGVFLCLNLSAIDAVATFTSDEQRASFLPKAFAYTAALLPGLGGFAAAFACLSGLASAERQATQLPGRPFELEPLWIILACVGSAVFVGASLLSALRSHAGVFERLGVRSVPLWVTFTLLLALGWAPATVMNSLSPTVDAYLHNLQSKITHAASNPSAPTHFYPNARSVMLSAKPKVTPLESTQGSSP